MRPPMISRGYLGCWTHLCSRVTSISLSSHTGHACLVQVSCINGVHRCMNPLVLNVVCKNVLGIGTKLTEVLMVVESIGASCHHLAHVVCFLSTQCLNQEMLKVS